MTDPEPDRPNAAAPPSAPVRALARVPGALAVVLFVVLTAVVALQVLTRFVLHLPFIGSEEIARFVFFWVVMLGAAQSVRNRRHFTLDIPALRRRLSGRAARFFFRVFPDACVLAVSVFLLVQGSAYARTGLLRTATNTNLNMAIVYAAIPVFGALSALYSIAHLVGSVRALRAGAVEERPPTEPAE